ncbi:MAG: sigma-54-dependent Fis family transcriptional regulator, partial [Calditrichaeota bacterium]|nr:sigma-54-dependent Fis family transcriptional regulator [Calditrichota bacterium]
MKHKILLVEDDVNTLNGLSEILIDEGYDIGKAKNASQAMKAIQDREYELILLDYLLPDQDGLSVSGKILADQPGLPIIMMTAFGTIKNAVEAMKLGIFDYLTKPINLDELLIQIPRALESRRLERENQDLRQKINQTYSFDNIVGISGKMQSVFAKVTKVANSDA